jgi:hypothetical protein
MRTSLRFPTILNKWVSTNKKRMSYNLYTVEFGGGVG